jgi:hypothetical protein
MSPRLGLAKLALGHVRNKETASVAPGWPSNLGNPKHGISAEAASRDDPLGGSGRLLPPEPFVVNLPNSEVEGVRVGLFGVVRPIGDVEYVEDRVCTFAGEADWLAAGADEDEFDLVGDLTRSLDTFITQLPGRFPAQILPGHRCCRLVERVKLARDLEDDIHASEAIRIPLSNRGCRRRPTTGVFGLSAWARNSPLPALGGSHVHRNPPVALPPTVPASELDEVVKGARVRHIRGTQDGPLVKVVRRRNVFEGPPEVRDEE